MTEQWAQARAALAARLPGIVAAKGEHHPWAVIVRQMTESSWLPVTASSSYSYEETWLQFAALVTAGLDAAEL